MFSKGNPSEKIYFTQAPQKEGRATVSSLIEENKI
tara:strand:- start:112 stop:216 length:105 start_codon:yes stop_codon:yes gene_type:complete